MCVRVRVCVCVVLLLLWSNDRMVLELGADLWHPRNQQIWKGMSGVKYRKNFRMTTQIVLIFKIWLHTLLFSCFQTSLKVYFFTNKVYGKNPSFHSQNLKSIVWPLIFEFFQDKRMENKKKYSKLHFLILSRSFSRLNFYFFYIL